MDWRPISGKYTQPYKNIYYYIDGECDTHRLWAKYCTGVGKILVDQDYDNKFGFLTILSNF